MPVYRIRNPRSRRAPRLRMLALCSALLLVAAAPFPAAGYVPFVDLNGAPYSWDVSSQPGGRIAWRIEPGAPAMAHDAMLYATQRWTEATGGNLQFVEAPPDADPNAAFYGIIVNWDADGSRLVDPGFLAYATFSVGAATHRIAAARIVVNAHDYGWHCGEPYGQTYAADGTRTADLDGVLLHELGHCIGLDHSDKNPAAIIGATGYNNLPTMNSVVYPGIESLHLDDISGAQSLYGLGGIPSNGYQAGPPLEIAAQPTRRKRRATYAFSTLNGGDESTQWDFGDDETANGAQVEHRFRWRGEFTVIALWHGQVAKITVKGRRGRVRPIDLLRGKRRKQGHHR